MITTSAFQIASRFIGVREVAGSVNNPQIMAMLRLDNDWPSGDEVAWCSAFCNYVAWLLDLPRSKSLAARSWLPIGRKVEHIELAQPDSDIVILQRGSGEQPGPEVLTAPGHVGFFAGYQDEIVRILGGNQGNMVSIQPYSTAHILGIRRLS